MNRYQGNITAPIGSGNPIQYAAGYTVYVTPVGARVAVSTGHSSSITLDRGHSFRVGDRFLLNPGTDNVFSAAITAVSDSANTITTGATTYNLIAGDVLVNLGPDESSGSTPDYDKIPMGITDQPDGGGIYATPSVNTDTQGNFEFYHHGDGKFWLLICDSTGTPTAVQQGVGGIGRNNVADYGAMPGESDSSTTRIEAAAAACPTGGGEVFFPPGDYTLGARVDIDRGNLRVVFARGARLVVDAVSITCLQIQGTVSARIADVEIIDPNCYDPDAVAHSNGEQTTGINVAYCDGINIIRGNFYGLGDEGIVLNSCTNFHIDSPEMEECCLTDSSSGSLSINGTYGGIINAPRITNNGTGAAIRIEVTDPPTEAAALADDITIVAPYIDTCRADIDPTFEDNGVGIAIVPNNRTGRSITILGGVIKDADKCAVYCTPVGGTGTMLSIQGLQVKDGGDNAKLTTQRGGINIAEGWTQASVVGCVIDGWGLAGEADHHGIRVANDKCALVGNSIINVPGFAIFIDGDGTDGNVISSNYAPDGIRPDAADRCHGNIVATAGALPELLSNAGAVNSTTPSVGGIDVVKTANTIATTITNLINGTVGQTVIIIFKDTNTTLDFSSNANMKGNGGVDFTGAVDDHCRCTYDGSVWHCHPEVI